MLASVSAERTSAEASVTGAGKLWARDRDVHEHGERPFARRRGSFGFAANLKETSSAHRSRHQPFGTVTTTTRCPGERKRRASAPSSAALTASTWAETRARRARVASL